MVSRQAALSQKERRACPTNSSSDDNSSSKKRKWEVGEGRDHLEAALPKELKLWKDEDNDAKLVIQPPAAAAFGIDLHLDTPLPPEWQRCLDIQSGKIHFYNTRTHKRTSRDPRGNAEEAPPLPSTDAQPVRLDLELNLMCETSPRGHGGGGGEEKKSEKGRTDGADLSCDHRVRPGSALCTTPPWVSLDADPGEMVATVCGRCHMLVMMCKSSPSCPNCKFLHPPDQMPPSALLNFGRHALVL